MSDRFGIKAHQKLITEWNVLAELMREASPGVDIKPDDSVRVFQTRKPPHAGLAVFDIGPLVFRVPEQANRPTKFIYVVVKGRLAVEQDKDGSPDSYLTDSFSTESGYFREKNNRLVHVYGAHYDFAPNETGHPAFHVQVKNFQKFSQHVVDLYSLNLAEVGDGLGNVIKNVRVPTAQMDVFSLFLQIFADHLVSSGSEQKIRDDFRLLRDRSGWLRGAASRANELASEDAGSCFRSRHWYPNSAEE